MNYSIVEVKGLSMGPFLISNEMVLVDLNIPQEKFVIGALYFDHKVVHRAISENILKGDRLIYNDQFSTHKKFKVLGRIIKQSPLIFSDYNSIALLTISKIIALLSRYNCHQNKFKKLSLFFILILSQLHRLLENVFTSRKPI
jgi:hypothetical protein